MTILHGAPDGNRKKEAIDSLRGYVYQIYQSALAWIELDDDEILYLEVAEDFALLANNALTGIQVKDTVGRVTINSDGIIATINNFVEIQKKNSNLDVSIRHLTTSTIGKEKSSDYRIGDTPTLVAWRNLAKMGDLNDLRRILDKSKLSNQTKEFIKSLNDNDFREKFLKKIHFDCGAPCSNELKKIISSKLSILIRERGGVHSQIKNCKSNIVFKLLEISTTKERECRRVDRLELEKILEEATQIVLNKAQYEKQVQLLNKMLSMPTSFENKLSDSVDYGLSSVSQALLPNVLATRNIFISQLIKTLENQGICWITGAAGVGKTLSARIIALRSEGNWGAINLRGLTKEQVNATLSHLAENIASYDFHGIIVDDLNCSMEGEILDSFSYLFYIVNRSDALLVVTSSNPPSSEFLFNNSLRSDTAATLAEFTPEDVEEILVKLGINDDRWIKYIYLVSGGGHPQLAIAFIQSMSSSGWNHEELKTMNSLLEGNPEVNEIKKRVRKRLLKDLQQDSHRLIERLSLQVGGFNRELAIDLGKLSPPIENAGIILDNLTGSWIDQHNNNRFSLSPLLSDFATTTLTTDEKEKIQSSIADSLTKGTTFNTIDMNSALIAALSGKNFKVILKVCLSLFNASNEELEYLAPHLSVITSFRTDKFAISSEPTMSHIFRGVQLLLVNLEEKSNTNIDDVLHIFSEESKKVQNDVMKSMTNLIVYSKLLLQDSKSGLGVHFIKVIDILDTLLENKNSILPAESLSGFESHNKEKEPIIGFMFLNQARQITKIKDLITLFNFLDDSSEGLRSRLLSPLFRDDINTDMFISYAWLSEHKNNTIDSSIHSEIYLRFEKQALNWNQKELAVCCRKFQAIILDEYGNDKASALAVLDEGLEFYGETNSELVRAKARVLYRSDDHAASLSISSELIESNAPLSEIEKAFLGREAAISAEKQGDFNKARKYYLYGREAAKNKNTPDLSSMSVGLLADAALASWHNGDRLTCLQDFVVVLSELNKLDTNQTISSAHCHAISRHVLLWLNQDATGKRILLEDHKETKIYPGCVSNPEPNPEIAKRFIVPIEMAWYMLATVENHASINAGITRNLERFLPNGPVLEGQMQLCFAKIYNALANLDVELFIEGLKESVSYYAYIKEDKKLDVENITYGVFPIPSKQQKESFRKITELNVLLYLAMYIIKEKTISNESVINKISVLTDYGIRPSLLDSLRYEGPEEDFETGFAHLLFVHNLSLSGSSLVSPRQVFELAIKVLQIADETGNYRLVSKVLLPWLKLKWNLIWKNQRLLLNDVTSHHSLIETTLGKRLISEEAQVTNLLLAILPTLEITNSDEITKILMALSEKYK